MVLSKEISTTVTTRIVRGSATFTTQIIILYHNNYSSSKKDNLYYPGNKFC